MRLVKALVKNPVAANMLMILILGGGLISAFIIPRELFPEFELDYITVTTVYPGAAPSDIEESICWRVEDALEGVEGIKEISSTSREGVGTVTAELQSSADRRKVLDDIKSRVDEVKVDFPDRAEEPNVQELSLRRHVIHVAVGMPGAPDNPSQAEREAIERTLKEYADNIRDELTDLPTISQAGVSGVRDYEILIEVREQDLRKHDLTLAAVAAAVRAHGQDIPAGKVRTSSGEMSIRVVGRKYSAAEYRDIPLLSRATGSVTRLEEVATVREGFEDVDIGGLFNGKPAALVSVYKTEDEDSIEIVRAVRKYVADKKGSLPAGIAVEPWADTARLIEGRLDMLVRNGAWGLGLVFLTLLLFLNSRLSFWVAMGIPISVLGTILVMNATGATLNMMSMFALIMALGLIVDDAIVVGENVYQHVERGGKPTISAVLGTKGVLLPVIGAVMTTWLAFVPLLFIPGIMGRFIEILPQVIILALAFSLVECLLILPSHLAHSLESVEKSQAKPPRGPLGRAHRRWRGLTGRVRGAMDSGVQFLIHSLFGRLYRLCARFRYATIMAVVAVSVLTLGAFRSGFIEWVGFPEVDSDTLQAPLLMETGTSIGRTEEAAEQISNAALKLNTQFQTDTGEPVVERVYSLLGSQSGRRGPGESGSHVAEVIVELVPSERRGIKSDVIQRQWEQNVGYIQGAQSFKTASFRGGPGGKDIEIRLLGERTADLKPIASEVREKLAQFPGVRNIEDDALPGKMEMRIRLRQPMANTLGVSLSGLGEQLRSRFEGNESLTIQRGDDEIEVTIRYPDEQRTSIADVEDLQVNINGAMIPFTEVAQVELERGYTTLRRVDGRSVITVSADVDRQRTNAEAILAQLRREKYFDQLRSLHPNLTVDLQGQRQQTFDSLNALKVFFPLALLGIYTILASIFKSYLQPMIIMLAIPFGLVGAALGHAVMGFDLSLLSVFGMVALAGIVVNDSLVLVDNINLRTRGGEPVFRAVEEAAKQRFRPIILTTVTTVAGIAPLLAERSLQAQFLKPMAVSLAFGLIFATTLTLLVVPCLFLIGNDLRRIISWLITGQMPAPEDVIKQAPTLEGLDEVEDSNDLSDLDEEEAREDPPRPAPAAQPKPGQA